MSDFKFVSEVNLKVYKAKLTHLKNYLKITNKNRRLEIEHKAEIQNLERKDKQELLRVRNTMDRLQSEFETFMHAEISFLGDPPSDPDFRMRRNNTRSHTPPHATTSSLHTGIVGTKMRDLAYYHADRTDVYGISPKGLSQPASSRMHRSPPPRKPSSAPSEVRDSTRLYYYNYYY